MKYLSTLILSALSILLLNSCGSEKEMAATVPGSQPADVFIDNQAAQEAFVDALKAKLLEDYEDAEKLFQRSLKLDPNNAAAYYELAVIYFRQGDYDQALKHIKPAVELEATNKWYSLLYAEVLSYKNQFMQAAGVYERLIKQNPAEVELYFDWAYMLIKAEKFEEAIKVYDTFEAEMGIDENVIVQKQRLYVRMGKIEKAAAEVKKLIASDPAEPRFYKLLADLYEANNMKDKAAKVYEDLLRIDRDNPNALLYLAEMYRMKGDQAQAMEHLKKAFSNPAMDIDTKVRILFPYLQQMIANQTDKKEEAFMLAELLIESHPAEAKAHAIYGDLLYQDKQLDNALAQYQQALELDSSVFEIWQQIFFIQSERKQYEELARITTSALELYPNQPIVYFFNGIANNQMKKYEEAAEILTLGEPLVIENPVLKAQMLSTLAESYNYLKRYAESDSAFERSLLSDPDNAFTLNNYSYYLSLRGENLERAEEMSARSNELVPGNASFEDTYAWILYKMEKYEQAKEWIEKAIEHDGGENPVILEHYGDILFKLGEEDKALNFWKKAESLGSESELIGKKIADKRIYE